MFARTERLMLRPGWREDARALHAAFCDEGIIRNLSRVPWPYRLRDAEDFLARERAPCEVSSLIFLRGEAAPTLIGSVGLGRTDEGGIELGYWVARAYWGRGIATEAGRAMIAHARDGLRLRALEAGHFVDNPASGRVLAKLGFRPTGATRGRYSAGRAAIAPCREFTLELGDDLEAENSRAMAA